MNLFELLDRSRVASAPGVPVWALGSFRRRSITFFDGSTDSTTLVIWLQSRGLTFDLRLAADRPRPGDRSALVDASPDDLVRLAQAEGGIARTIAHDDPATSTAVFRWDDWDAFQPYAKWPEPGLLRRVGDCLIEFAPSGAYVEDWRHQSAGTGSLIGLRLIEERDLERGAVLHRGGGLVVCGSHAGWVRGRAKPLAANSRAAELVRKSPTDRDLLEAVFDFEASYAERAPSGSFVVKASTLPWREGGTLVELDGFLPGDSDDVLVQRVEDRGMALERRFLVDTLESNCPGLESTAVSHEGASWFDTERDTLCAASRNAHAR
jgi:hypothetical protein